MSETCTTSAIVLISLLSAGSTVPSLGLAATIVLRILTLVQVKNNVGGLVDLANDSCGLVIALIVECRRVIKNGHDIPDRIQWHIQAFSGALILIESFTKKKLKRNFVKKLLNHNKDVAQIARYRETLRQLLGWIQAVNPSPDHEREVLRQSMVGTSSSHPMINLSPPSLSGPMYDSHPSSAPPPPPQRFFHPQPQGSFQNFSGANIFINSSPPSPPPAMNQNFFSGRMSTVSIINEH